MATIGFELPRGGEVMDEDEESFLMRRAAEERRKMAETSCMVRSVHEELVETYEARLEEASAQTAALEALVARLRAVGE